MGTKSGSGGIPLTIGLLLLAALIGLAFSPQGFTDYHLYGKHDATTSWASHLAPDELRFFLAYLLLGGGIALLLRAGLARSGIADRTLSLFRALAGSGTRRTGVLMFIAGTVLVAVLSWTALSGAPITDDEWVYLLQTEILATGHLTAPAPPLPDFFRNQYVVITDRIFGQYPFGHSFALLPAFLLGLPQLSCWLMSGLTVWFLYLAGRRLSGPATGLLAAALLLTSPQFLLTGGTLSSQVTFLALYAAFVWLFLTALDTRSPRFALAAGLVWGLNIQVRALDLLIATAPLWVMFAIRLLRSRRTLMRTAVIMILGISLTTGLYLATNWVVNGDPLTTNYNPLWKDHSSGADSAFGFGRYPWGLEHTPGKGLLHTWVNLVRTNFWLFGWPLSLLPFVLTGLRLRCIPAAERALWATVPLLFGVYFFYFWPGVADTGPLYQHSLLVPLALTAATFIRRWTASDSDSASGSIRSRSRRALAFSFVLLSLLFFLPIQVLTLRHNAEKVMAPYRLLREQNIHHAVVHTRQYFYVYSNNMPTAVLGLRNNKPDLSDDILLVRDLGKRNQELLRHFPGREPYRMFYDRRGKLNLVPLRPTHPLSGTAADTTLPGSESGGDQPFLLQGK